MKRNVEISIIIPYGYSSPDINSSILSVIQEKANCEIIVVTEEDLTKDIKPEILKNCRILKTDQKGRGFYCSAGVQNANAPILLFLHADTILPKGWSQRVLAIMSNNAISGGAFSVEFRSTKSFLKYLSTVYNAFSLMVKEYWGDRAIFIRKEVLVEKISRIEVPLMEDVEMSRIMRKKGKMVLLNETVSTGAFHFEQKGYLKHTLQVLIFRTLYMFGISTSRIYKWYYGHKI